METKARNLGRNLYHTQPAQPRDLFQRLFRIRSVTTRKINKELGRPGVSIWQRNYYEHIIRDEEEFARIVDYIKANPERWENGGL